ncbi:hypothetical protein CEXT_85051 [Caerostris extrusa]|uniref:Uncharacterized protein n=1 Tax=Caerostris extrusa TaxID=172846 RepID=A0AAV4UE43_CAEEX|nr:hypothetical protein CEXT_85051 [Caerostris extrusa]
MIEKEKKSNYGLAFYYPSDRDVAVFLTPTYIHGNKTHRNRDTMTLEVCESLHKAGCTGVKDDCLGVGGSCRVSCREGGGMKLRLERCAAYPTKGNCHANSLRVRQQGCGKRAYPPPLNERRSLKSVQKGSLSLANHLLPRTRK